MKINRKTLVKIFALAAFCFFFSATAVCAQENTNPPDELNEQDELPEDATPRDIFYNYNPSKSKQNSNNPTSQNGKSKKISAKETESNRQPGNNASGQRLIRKKPQPGAEVRLELIRGGAARFVSPQTVFYNGDRVRFHFKINFNGYVAIINEGSSGNVSLLFPCVAQNNRVTPTAAFRVPAGNESFEFTGVPGEEKLTFVMSLKPIAAVEEMLASGKSACGATHSLPRAQTKLRQLNDDSLGQGRDLTLVSDNGASSEAASYVLANEKTLQKPLGFKLRLIHR